MLAFSLHVNVHAQNTTLPVGTVQGSAGVSSMGAATYTIPIEVVPGTHGVQPELSVVYNSMTRCGILGEKCDLAGISAIGRVGKTLFHDNDITSVNLTFQDRFSLDGNRLVANSSSTYGSDGCVYYPEFYDFSKVISYGTQGNGPKSFKVFTDNGDILEYGNTENSRQMAGNTVLAWYLNKRTDADGNFINYTYRQSGGDIWIERIDYTGNAAANLRPYARVTFEYDSTSHVGTTYVAGRTIRHTRLLRSVKVLCRNGAAYDLVRQYDFTYSSDYPKKLVSVQLTASDQTSLNPTVFQWKELPTEGVDTTNFHISDFQNIGTHIAVDFNKDGLCDIVQIKDTKKFWNVFLKNGGQFQLYDQTYALPDEWNIVGCLPADIDGDGFSEIVTACKKENGSIFVSVTEYPFNTYDAIVSFPTQGFSGLHTGDFLGNGHHQILLQYRAQNHDCVKLTTDNGIIAQYIDGDNIELLDFDGDGQTEFMLVSNNLKIYKFNRTSQTFELVKTCNLSGYISSGDFNGDGITDILYRQNGIYKVALGTGDGFDTAVSSSLTLYHNTERYQLYPAVVDINNDGYDDIISFDTISSGLRVVYSLSQGYNNDILSFHTDPLYQTRPLILSIAEFQTNHSFLLGDYNDDHHIDIVSFKDYGINGKGVLLYEFQVDKRTPVVKRITEGDGSFVQWQHRDIHGLYYRYASNISIFPYHFDVVDRMTRSGGTISDTSSFYYGFFNPTYSFARRQVTGFAKAMTRDPLHARTDTTWFENVRDDIYNQCQDFLMPVRQTTIVDGTVTQTASHLYECRRLSHGRLVTNVSRDTLRSFVNGTVRCQTNAYLPTGRLCASVTNNYDMGSGTWLTRELTEPFYHTISLSGEAQRTVTDSVRVTSSLNGSSNGIIQRHHYQYDSGGRLVSTTQIADGTSVTQQYGTYDVFGNPTTVTLSSQGLASRTQTFSYDATGRFVLLETNALGHQTSRLYDPATGLVLSETDPNGLITRYSYDAFGRPDTIRYPDHTMRTFSYRWYVGSSIPAAKTYTVTAMTGQSNTEKYFDLLGRVVCTRQEGYYTDTRYNPTGTVLKTSAPYTSLHTADADKLWHTWQYDHLDRPTAEQGPHTDLSYSYTGRTVTTTDNLRQSVTTQTTDAAGRPLSVTDPGGTIGYQYAMDTYNGRPVLRTTITANGNATVLLFDARGNRLSIADPDAGTITCTYNAYGELRAQTDAREVTTSFAYDALGRVTNKTYANTDGILKRVAYSYDHYTSANRGRGRLYQVTMDNHPSKQFLYDTLGRLAEHTRYAEGLPYTDSYTYNSKSQVATRSFPDGYMMSYSYLSSGRMESVSLGNTRLLKVYGYNMYGQPSLCEYGNGLFTQRTYSPTGLLTRINTGEKHDVQFDPIVIQSLGDSPNLIVPDDPGPVILAYTVDSTVQNLRYNYDAMGRLTRRSQMNSRYETFQYDNLDRLTAFGQGTVNGTTQTYSTVYDGQGNIQSHTLAGSYAYEGAQPHAVTEVTPSADYPDAISAAQCATEYNCHNQPSRIAEEDVEIMLEYDAEGQRSKAVFKRSGQVERTRYYMGDYEREVDANGTVTHYHYVSGPMGLAAVVVTRGGADSLFYVHPDRLGSITHITNSAKQVVRALHFDPWGNVKSDADWTVFADTVLADTSRHFRLERGFTGHEHYTELKIINMNGRLYDPVIARFFSPDNFVQAPESTQGYNRYSYCLNNPLQWVDPSGEFLWEPDKQALIEGRGVRFIAQEGDDLYTFSIQSGLDYGYLKSLYGDMVFEAGHSYSFDEIPVIAKMNEFLHNGMNCENYNCRSFALFVNGIFNDNFDYDPTVISEQLQNVSSVSHSTIGDVISLAETYEYFYKQYWTHNDNPYWYSEKEFYAYYVSGYSTRITHYSVVLLKSPDGNDISWIIEKRGKFPVNISTFPSLQKEDSEGHYYQPYNPTPIQPNHSTFLYRHH